MKFPDEYIKRGRFRLHSGAVSDIFYDVNALLTDKEYFSDIINRVPLAEHYVGIATGGAIIASAVSLNYKKPYSIIKDAELKGKVPEDNWVLIDDVATTESSLKKAIELVGSSPKSIFVVVDRRRPQDKRLKLESMFEV